jgi:hypothetical protein
MVKMEAWLYNSEDLNLYANKLMNMHHPAAEGNLSSMEMP